MKTNLNHQNNLRQGAIFLFALFCCLLFTQALNSGTSKAEKCKKQESLILSCKSVASTSTIINDLRPGLENKFEEFSFLYLLKEDQFQYCTNSKRTISRSKATHLLTGGFYVYPAVDDADPDLS